MGIDLLVACVRSNNESSMDMLEMLDIQKRLGLLQLITKVISDLAYLKSLTRPGNKSFYSFYVAKFMPNSTG